MIRDTSAQDRLIKVAPSRKKKFLWIGAGVAAVIALALVLPGIMRLFSADSSVSASRLAFATVERGPFVRDIAAEGQVVAAVSPTLYATYGGAVTLKVHAGDYVKKGEVLAVVDSPELVNKLAQEESNADAMQVDYLRAENESSKQTSQMEKALDNAKIDDQTAKRDLARYETAYKGGGVTEMDVDRAKDTVEKADITLKHAESDRNLNSASGHFDIQAKKLAHDRQVLMVEDLKRQVDNLNVRRRWTARSASCSSPNARPSPRTRSCSA